MNGRGDETIIRLVIMTVIISVLVFVSALEISMNEFVAVTVIIIVTVRVIT